MKRRLRDRTGEQAEVGNAEFGFGIVALAPSRIVEGLLNVEDDGCGVVWRD